MWRQRVPATADPKLEPNKPHVDFDPDPFMESLPEAPVCLDCLIDDGLKRFFASGLTQQFIDDCGFCEARRCPTISAVAVQDLIRSHCLAEKNLAVEELSSCTAEGGYRGER